jgi:hypothetical protein
MIEMVFSVPPANCSDLTSHHDRSLPHFVKCIIYIFFYAIWNHEMNKETKVKYTS